MEGHPHESNYHDRSKTGQTDIGLPKVREGRCGLQRVSGGHQENVLPYVARQAAHARAILAVKLVIPLRCTSREGFRAEVVKDPDHLVAPTWNLSEDLEGRLPQVIFLLDHPKIIEKRYYGVDEDDVDALTSYIRGEWFTLFLQPHVVAPEGIDRCIEALPQVTKRMS